MINMYIDQHLLQKSWKCKLSFTSVPRDVFVAWLKCNHRDSMCTFYEKNYSSLLLSIQISFFCELHNSHSPNVFLFILHTKKKSIELLSELFFTSSNTVRVENAVALGIYNNYYYFEVGRLREFCFLFYNKVLNFVVCKIWFI
jgi:hypothetical protein